VLKWAILGVRGEFCTGSTREGCERGEFCTGIGPACGIKFSLHAENGPQWAFWREPGEFCTGIACQGREWGEFCTGIGPACGTKFSLLDLLVVKAV